MYIENATKIILKTIHDITKIFIVIEVLPLYFRKLPSGEILNWGKTKQCLPTFHTAPLTILTHFTTASPFVRQAT